MSSNSSNVVDTLTMATGGNTKTPVSHDAAPASNKKQISPAKRWCFTIFKFNEKTWKSDISSMFQRNDLFCVGFEICPNTLNTHLQGFCSFAKKERPLKRFQDKFPGIHFEKCRGTDLQNGMYCSKDGDFILQNMKLIKPFNVDSLITLYTKSLEEDEDTRALTRTMFHDFVFEMIIKQKVNYPTSIARQKEVSDVAFQVCCLHRSMTIKNQERKNDELITERLPTPEKTFEELMDWDNDEKKQVEFDDDGNMIFVDNDNEFKMFV